MSSKTTSGVEDMLEWLSERLEQNRQQIDDVQTDYMSWLNDLSSRSKRKTT